MCCAARCVWRDGSHFATESRRRVNWLFAHGALVGKVNPEAWEAVRPAGGVNTQRTKRTGH